MAQNAESEGEWAGNRARARPIRASDRHGDWLLSARIGHAGVMPKKPKVVPLRSVVSIEEEKNQVIASDPKTQRIILEPDETSLRMATLPSLYLCRS